MKIFNQDKVTTFLPKLIEFDDYVVLQGQVHDKNTFKPKKLQFMILPTDTNMVMAPHKFAIIPNNIYNTGYSENVYHSSWIRDSENSNIIYKFMGKAGGKNGATVLAKIQITKDGPVILAYSAPNWVTSENQQIMGQSKDYVYTHHTNATADPASSNYQMIWKKSDLTMVNAGHGAWHASKALETSTYIFKVSESSNNAFHYDVFNKATNINTTILNTDLLDGAGVMRQRANDVTYKISDNLYDTYHIVDGAGSSPVCIYTPRFKVARLDSNLGTWLNVDDVTVDFSKVELGDFRPHGSVNSYHRWYDIKGLNIKGEEFILVSLLNNHPSSDASTASTNGAVDPESAYTYLLKKTGRTTMECVSVYKHSTVQSAVLYADNSYTLIFGCRSKMTVASINTTTFKIETKKTVDFVNPQLGVIGLDSNDNIYYQTTDSAIEKLESTAGVDVIVEYEKEFYEESTDEEITTFVNVGITNVFGEFRNANIRLRLIGPQTFADGDKIKDISLSSAGLIKVPIIFIGEGLMDYTYEIL